MKKVKDIKNFSGPHSFLSNFFHTSFIWRGMKWTTAEHAFQAAKTTDLEAQDNIRCAESPGMAKRMGRMVELREDWDDIKISVMKSIVKAKFEQNPHLRSALLKTGDAHIEEGNTWGDRFWGTVNGEGENHLGEILMEVRDEL